MQTKKDKKKNAEVTITGTLSKEQVAAHFDKTLARIAKEVELKGFRKGNAPVEKVREYVGDKALWKEAAESALNAEVESILKEHEVLPIMPVGASLKTSDVDADVPFEIIAVTAPTCSVEGYKEVAKKAADKAELPEEAKEKENAMNALRQQARQMVQSQGEGELTDDEAKKLGFENAKAFEFFLGEEADRAVAERILQIKRGAIAEALIEKGACDIPHALINQEASQLVEATKKDIASRGLPFNDYLKQIGKTEDQVRDELKAPAEKRVALDIIFGEIARKEDIKPNAEEEDRLAHALQAQGVDHETAHRYVRNTVIREKVWEILGAKSNSPFSGKEDDEQEKPASEDKKTSA